MTKMNTYILMLVLVVSLILAGCTKAESAPIHIESSGTNTMTEIWDSRYAEPPNAVGVVENIEILLIKGSYQWLYAIADAPSPDELVKTSTVYVVKPNAQLILAFEGKEPAEIWGGLWINQNFAPLPIEEGIIRLPSEPGIYVLSVGGNWSEGYVSYAAAIEVKEWGEIS